MNIRKMIITCIVVVIISMGCVSKEVVEVNGVRMYVQEPIGNFIGFFIKIPENWELVEAQGLYFRVLQGPEDGLIPNIMFIEETFEGNMEEYTEHALSNLAERFVEENIEEAQQFKTSSGVTGAVIPVTITGQESKKQYYFIFSGENNINIIIICTGPDNEKYTQLFFDTVKTFTWGNPSRRK